MNTTTITKNENDCLIPDNLTQLSMGPEWLKEIRNKAKESYNNNPLPPRGLALWRYTDPVDFVINYDNISKHVETKDHDDNIKLQQSKLKQEQISALVIDNSSLEINISTSDTLKKSNVIISSLSLALNQHEDIVKKYLSTIVNQETGKFEALNTALWNDGIFIYVPDNSTVNQPIHLVHLSEKSISTFFSRVLIVTGKNSEVTIIDEYVGGSESSGNLSQTNCVVEIFNGDDSKCQYIPLQHQSTESNIVLTHRAVIERNSTMLTIPLIFGGNVSKHNFGIHLAGQGAKSNIHGMLFGTGHQHFDNHTLHHHQVSNTNSDIDFKVIVRDKALSAYTGLIRIEKKAPMCEAYQVNRNLMLNRGTRAETIPELEILNEEVICSHGATIGPIDPEMIYYLSCRGIDKKQATKMIVSGFVSTTLKEIPENLKDRIMDIVDNQLEGI